MVEACDSACLRQLDVGNRAEAIWRASPVWFTRQAKSSLAPLEVPQMLAPLESVRRAVGHQVARRGRKAKAVAAYVHEEIVAPRG